MKRREPNPNASAEEIAEQLFAYGYLGTDDYGNPIDPANHSWGKRWMLIAAEHIRRTNAEPRQEEDVQSSQEG